MPPGHPGWATLGAILFVLGIVGYCALIFYRTRRAKAKAKLERERSASLNEDGGGGDDERKPAHRSSIYDLLAPHAKNVKAAFQMAIGLITVTVVIWQYLDSLGHGDPIKLFLNGIGIGLAAAAALELAYTLFTDGPDEALDPLMLGLSSTLLLNLAGLSSPPSWSHVGVLAVLALILVGLFAARLMLIESTDEQPRIWWIVRLKAQNVDSGQPSAEKNALTVEATRRPDL
jgi:hypothetical protein